MEIGICCFSVMDVPFWHSEIYNCSTNIVTMNFVFLIDQPLNLAQPSQSLARQMSPSQLPSQPNSSQNSAASSFSSLILASTTSVNSSNIATSLGVLLHFVQDALEH